jgi:Transposase DNA-binding
MAKQLGKRESEATSEEWIDEELAGCEFRDERLTKRFEKLFRQLSGGIGESIPWACQDWTSTKAAYRFFANGRVSEMAILGGHFQATEKRLASGAWPILMLHDATELNFYRKDVAAVGMTTRMPTRKLDGKPQHNDVCGILMHSSLAVTLDGLPLGLAAIKFWSPDKFYGCNQLKKRINRTRIPIEEKQSYRWLDNVRQATALLEQPQRCVHIGDRESDIYELFCTAHSIGTHFLLRTCLDRLAGDGKHTISAEMAEVRVQGLHRIQIRDRKGNPTEAILEIHYRRKTPPIKSRGELRTLTQRIRLHDFVADITRRLVPEVGQDKLSAQGPSDGDSFIARLRKYEEIIQTVLPVQMLLGRCGLPDHAEIAALPLRRLAGGIAPTGGNTHLIQARWYPVFLLRYAGCLGAMPRRV